jgi:hypothetical protein
VLPTWTATTSLGLGPFSALGGGVPTLRVSAHLRCVLLLCGHPKQPKLHQAGTMEPSMVGDGHVLTCAHVVATLAAWIDPILSGRRIRIVQLRSLCVLKDTHSRRSAAHAGRR